MHNWRNYRKALAPLVIAIVTVPIAWVSTGEFDVEEWTAGISLAVTSVITYWVKNDPVF